VSKTQKALQKCKAFFFIGFELKCIQNTSTFYSR
jgi:hypothetical protein